MKFAAMDAVPPSLRSRTVAFRSPAVWRSGGCLVVDPKHYAVEETLKNGTAVTIRAARPGDESKIRHAFSNLTAETVYTRFFGYKTQVTDAELTRITGVDFDRDVALLVTIGAHEAETVIGGASYFATDPAAPYHSAELAFTIEEDYQGLGIASLLMRHLVRIAWSKGLHQLEADVLARNLPMLAVFKRSGLPMTLQREDDTVHVTLSLLPASE
jgi:RimJ/RimL family protein N-acetyltransferase